ncbi:3-phosphoshikimate 1-carboxyvinyltransferase [Hydrogenimonas thermophila]|uniref:3-phosphoshikimate 1-carboxyvinyltransferase n=1 Tax=Hydrogenimonas thermophila TaxID=223786 RepID=A0A1I5QSU1_9BACT|nr:3-phosphoshikimate 1-carboxyvinyltransferase [Hydrogenimonas thermophila]WOE69331.1 3-phosphoshikimate 1-carboxyvinyltransferase [Hydrogenimonas thermophila]WOE71841.1 3-phosphoshikimate 1-carboxyvinyltransferase [Hydrogenimonas thermophila]SFP49137.1 3-phosphoshikimate 1-carboxyvinyltransferase [Hydrogenimonas thermophila]
MKIMKVFSANKPVNMVCDKIASDKSISHRCAMFSLLSDQPSKICNFLKAEDTLNTLKIVEKLGADVSIDGNIVNIVPPKKVHEPDDVLDCGNSGTAIRLFCGFLSSLDGHFVLTGDKYLRRRPMRRVTDPLRKIGAKIDGREDGNLAPISIRGKELKSFHFESKIASAQVKSAMILAALRADAPSTYKEPELTRDHTERMLRGMGAKIESSEVIKIEPITKPLNPLDITVPADPSSGFFFAVAAAIVPDSKVVIKNTTLNPTRIEAYNVLKRMGAKVELIEKDNRYEPIGDIVVSYNGKLKGVEVSQKISWLIDELPALAIAMAVADGKSIVKNARELRVKESDRISCVIEGLKRCKIVCSEMEDGYTIEGGNLHSATINSYGDHRIAMSFAIGGLLADMVIEDIDCIATSFPNFIELLKELTEVNC